MLHNIKILKFMRENRNITSINYRVFGAMVIIVLMSLLAKLSMMAKDLVVANHFGTNEMLDAFLIAILLPNFAISVLTGSFSAALMPTYIRVREKQGIVVANRLFSSVLAVAIPLLLIVTLALYIISPWILPILGSGFDEKTLDLTQSLYLYLLPIFLLTGLGHLYATAINAGERFALVALTPGVTPLVVIASLILFVDQLGVSALVFGTVCGAGIELMILARIASCMHIPIFPKWIGMTSEFRAILRQYASIVAGAFLMSSTLIVDQSMAAMLGPGSVSALNYGNKVVALILGIGAMGLGTAVLPYFSRLVSSGKWLTLGHTWKTYSWFIIIISSPVTLFIMFFSDTIVSLIFERGEFTGQDTELVGEIQAYYSIQIPFYFLGILIVRMLSSMKKNHILLWGACISLPLNAFLNYVFMQFIGLPGIALSTSCVYMVSLIFLSFFLRRTLRKA